MITLPADWANYGNIIKDFSKKYGIKVNSENPDGTSADEIEAVTTEKGQSRAPDVLDMGPSFAFAAARRACLRRTRWQSWNEIPSNAKAANGDWFDDYGGYVAIGYDSKVVKTPPTSFADLLKPDLQEPGRAEREPDAGGRGLRRRLRGGPGQRRVVQQHRARESSTSRSWRPSGNFVPVTGGPSTVESGQTPILIWWDYLEESEVASSVPGLEGRHPDRRPLRLLLRPGHQRHGPRPRGGPPVGGVPLLGHRSEPLAAGLGPAD